VSDTRWRLPAGGWSSTTERWNLWLEAGDDEQTTRVCLGNGETTVVLTPHGANALAVLLAGAGARLRLTREAAAVPPSSREPIVASFVDQARRWRQARPGGGGADAERPTGSDAPASPVPADDDHRLDLPSLRPGSAVWTAGGRYVGTSKGPVRAPGAAARHRFVLRPTWRKVGDRQRYHLIDPDWDEAATDGSAEFAFTACGARIARAPVTGTACAGDPPSRSRCVNCGVVAAKVAREAGRPPQRCSDCGKAISASAKRCVKCQARLRVSARYRMHRPPTTSC
jgi:hypothetical protein